MSTKKKTKNNPKDSTPVTYLSLLTTVSGLLESARKTTYRAANTIIIQTYWEIGRLIFETEQGKKNRAEYGAEIVKQLSSDLSKKFGRGFSKANLEYMRRFYRLWPTAQTISGQLQIDNPLISVSC